MTAKAVLSLVLCVTSYVWGEEGILISGGTKSPASVEVFTPSSGETCSLPRLLQGGRYSHTMDTLQDRVVVCGGGDYAYSYKTCHTLESDSGAWTISHDLAQWRALHNSWVQGDNVILLAGWYSPYDSEVVGEGVDSFPMEHKTSYACSIPDLSTDSVIITGGYHYKQIVSRYDTLGFVEDLPSLLDERVSHGCGVYIRGGDGVQVLLVAGGHDNNGNTHDSTEILVGAASEWVYSTPLPRKIWSLKGVTIGGTLYMTGGEAIGDTEDTFLYLDEVLAWQEDGWVVAGRMSSPRVDHAATTIALDHPAMEYCV